VRYVALDPGPLPGRSATRATALGPAGHLVGAAWEPGARAARGFRWSPDGGAGRQDALGTFGGEESWHGSEAYAVDGAGRVVGWANGTGRLVDLTRPCLWRDGRPLDLGSLHPDDLGEGQARGINASGLIAGVSETRTAVLETNDHAFVYDPAAGRMLDLGIDDSHANGINAAGQVVGAYFTPREEQHAFLYDPAFGAVDLHALVGAGGRSSEAAAINDWGLVVGWATDARRTRHAFAADPYSGWTVHLEGEESLAYAVNNLGLVVGYYRHLGVFMRALRWDLTTGEKSDLNGLLSPEDEADRYGLPEAWGVNDAGQIAVSGGHTVDGVRHERAILLTPA
jgi:probable HAF family extracellular repeat protein